MSEPQDTNEAACGRSDSTEVLGVDVCPVCGRTWPHPSEQGRCVELFGECVVCRFVPVGVGPNIRGSGAGTPEDLAALQTPNGSN